MIPSGNLKAIENDPFSSMVIFHSFLYVYQRVNMMILPSMDWLKGKFTGKHHI
jgi:hypothetical protein